MADNQLWAEPLIILPTHTLCTNINRQILPIVANYTLTIPPETEWANILVVHFTQDNQHVILARLHSGSGSY